MLFQLPLRRGCIFLLLGTNYSNGEMWPRICCHIFAGEPIIPMRKCGLESAATSLQEKKIDNGFVCYIPESDNSKVLWADPPSNGVYKHSDILTLTGWLDVLFPRLMTIPRFLQRRRRSSHCSSKGRTDYGVMSQASVSSL